MMRKDKIRSALRQIVFALPRHFVLITFGDGDVL
jgi:hypothetical protein